MSRLHPNPKKGKLFEPAFLGPLAVKNRLVMAPMGTRMASEVGGITQKQIDYYSERAKGGVGTIITEITSVDHPLGGTGPTTLTFHDNGYIGGHNELVEAVHGYGARIICQLAHAGRQTRPTSVKGLQPVAPSAIACRFLNVLPRELSTGEVEEIVQKFIEAARRAKTAGYDGVELHGAHGYLIAQFLSPCSNQRTDRYGGSFRNRMNFPLEIIRGIKKSLGDQYPLLFRLSADEFVENGRSLEESKELARVLEEKGVHVLDVSAGLYDSMPKLMEPMSYPEGWKIYLAEEIKKVVKIPVIGVGVIRNPAFAEKILREGRVDFVALGRALLADPHWANKAREGRVEDINRCISCNIGCIGGRVFRDLHIRCSVNPVTGREREYGSLAPAEKRKKVLVVGGGPAGMEAACIAKRRGHQVILVEKNPKLGGQLLLAAAPPGKEKINWYTDYLIGQIKKWKVKIHLKQGVTLQYIQKMKPDVVILATGAVPWIPDIPGIQSPQVVKAWDILERKKKIEDSTVVVAGGGTVGCETALFLAPRNQKVIVVEMLERIALDMEPINRWDLQEKMGEAGIEVEVEKKIREITKEGVILAGGEGETELVKADWVVLALGVKPNDSLFKKLEGKFPEIYLIGDCYQAGKIIDASYGGFRTARLI
jgi:2,4-dienoyl-CoA reductase-like NADH-dependent reductase (Old Yellow Enzyme family)/thioredoxin reductase